MNTFVFLVITMGSKHGINYQGYGGISVTPMPSIEICEMMKSSTINQIKKTDYIEFDDNEIIINCVEKESNNLPKKLKV